MGLYKDDGLLITYYLQQTDRKQKKIISIFKNIDFKIEMVTNLTEVDFPDVTFNLESNTYHPRCASRVFRGQGPKLYKKGQTSIEQKRNEYKSYIGDNFLIIRRYKIMFTYDCR